jgi:hypothetical protein
VSNPNDGYTKLYRLRDKPGNYTATLIDSLKLNEPVTGAALNADSTILVLLTYFSLYVIRDFPGTDFF